MNEDKPLFLIIGKTMINTSCIFGVMVRKHFVSHDWVWSVTRGESIKWTMTYEFVIYGREKVLWRSFSHNEHRKYVVTLYQKVVRYIRDNIKETENG